MALSPIEVDWIDWLSDWNPARSSGRGIRIERVCPTTSRAELVMKNIEKITTSGRPGVQPHIAHDDGGV